MKRFLVLSVMVGVLAACGGGGGSSSSGGSGGGGGGTPSPSPTSQDYAIFASATSAATSLKAYDPNTNTITTIPTTNLSYEAGILDGTVDPTTLTTTNLHLSDVLFIDNGKIESVSPAASGNLAVTQHSNYSGTICSHTLFNNYLVITDQGPDLTCGTVDDIVYAVTTKMSSTDSPITLPANPLTVLFTDYTTAIGMLYVDKGTSSLYFVDANGQTPKFQSNVTSVTKMDTVGSSVLLNIDGNVKVFDDQTLLLSLTRHAASPSLATAINDGKNYYFLDGANLYKMPVDGSANATLVTTLATASTYSLLFVDNNYLVYTTNSSTGQTLNSINLTTPGGVLQLATAPTTSLTVVGFGGDYIYYNVSTTSGTDVSGDTAYAIKTDGTNQQQFPVSEWYGSTFATTITPGNNISKSLAYVVLNAFTTDASNNVTGAKISVYDAATDTLASDQGNLPTNVLAFTGSGIGTDFYGEFIDMSTSSAYLAHLSATTANSMQQIDTSTTAVKDGMIY